MPRTLVAALAGTLIERARRAAALMANNRPAMRGRAADDRVRMFGFGVLALCV